LVGMGTTASGHPYECHPYGRSVSLDSNPWTLSSKAMCSSCTGDGPRGICRDEDEEVLVEPCSILEELGLQQSYCSILAKGLPPSPARAGLGARTFSSPAASFTSPPTLGSPSFNFCPAPLAHGAESPSRADGVPFEGSVVSMPKSVIMTPISQAVSQVRPCPSMMPGPKAPIAVALEARRYVQDGPDTPDAKDRSLHGAASTPPQLVAVPAQEMRKITPWTAQGEYGWSPKKRSPYRGGVLCLFTPSPPSPPRRPIAQCVSPEAEDVDELKDLDEDAQIARVLERSLREVGPPRRPEPPPPPMPKQPLQSTSKSPSVRKMRSWRTSLRLSPRMSM